MGLDTFRQFLLNAHEKSATDVILKKGTGARVRIGGALREIRDLSFSGDEVTLVARELLSTSDWEELRTSRQIRGMLEINEGLKIRYHFSYERDSLFMTSRLLPTSVRSWENLEIPRLALNFLNKKQGLILVSGPLNSGKTSTLASFTEFLNTQRRQHIIVIDELIEHRIKSNQCIVNLRQVQTDTHSYTTALRFALREDPDILVIGSITGEASAQIVLNIAETGHLVIGALPTTGSLSTIRRFLNCFPASELENARMQLSAYLIGILSQVLVPNLRSSQLVPIFEVMTITPSISNLIRMNKMNQLQAEFSRTVKGVSLCFEDSAKELITKGQVSPDIRRQAPWAESLTE